MKSADKAVACDEKDCEYYNKRIDQHCEYGENGEGCIHDNETREGNFVIAHEYKSPNGIIVISAYAFHNNQINFMRLDDAKGIAKNLSKREHRKYKVYEVVEV